MMKKCPYCNEEIQDEAIKCKYCGEWIEKTKMKVNEHEIQKSKNENKNEVLLKGLSEKERKFIYSFSRGGFFLPTIMLFYTKKYVWAVLCLILSLVGSILGIIPRAIVGGGARKRAYLNNTYDDFNDFKEKIRNMETICTVIGIILIAIALLILIGSS